MSLLDILTDEDEEIEKVSRINGVAIGIVTNNNDPDGMGRVKVKFPWLSDANESSWARVSTLMAGNDRGSFFLPEVDDEVLVAFDHGDIHFPFVIGALWNGVDKPPADNSDGKNNIRKIKSRMGHEITFSDEDSKGKLEILTKAGHKIVLDDSGGGEKIEINDKTGGNSILIDSAQNSIAISSQTKLSIKSQTIEMEAGGTMTIKSSGTLTIQGSLVKIN